MQDGLKVMDSDLHVIETGEVYEKFFKGPAGVEPPRYLGWAPTNFPYWDVQGRMIPPWAESADVIGPQKALDAPSDAMYKPIRERGYDARSTLVAMDQEGIDVGIVYRTFGAMVVSIDGLDPVYAAACCAAFNDWLADYCGGDRKRLRPAAIVSLHDPELAAEEARRSVEENGHVAVVLLPMPCGGRMFNAPECDVLWREVTRLGVPLAFHGTSGGAGADYVTNRFRGHDNFRTLNHTAAFPLELMMAMGSMLVGGVLERFPDMRVAFLEGNCGWLPWWLDRLDDQWKKYGGGEAIQLSALPSEYFLRQCFIGTDVDETLLAVLIDKYGDDNVVMSVDYPHADGPFPDGVKEFLNLPGVGRGSKQKIMWENCCRLYGFDRESGAELGDESDA